MPDYGAGRLPEQEADAVPLVDVLLVLVLILMMAGTVWGWLRGYARFDVTTAVWLIVLALVLLMVIAPWPVRHAYAGANQCRPRRRAAESARDPSMWLICAIQRTK
jgi:hypothetical protein